MAAFHAGLFLALVARVTGQPVDKEWPFAPLQPADLGHADLQVLLNNSAGAAARMTGGDKIVGVMFRPDINGRPCFGCPVDIEVESEGAPPRSWFPPDYVYVNRTDCGNHSLGEHPELGSVPVASFSAPARPGHNATNGFCELNFFSICSTAMYNRDFIYLAKNYFTPDWYRNRTVKNKAYCKYNGFFDPEIVALQFDFDGMQAKSDELCSTKYAKKFDLSSITMDQFAAVKLKEVDRGYPTRAEAEFEAAFNCAMGGIGCEMAWCSYNFCDKGNGQFGVYEECEGWTPMGGMPVRTA